MRLAHDSNNSDSTGCSHWLCSQLGHQYLLVLAGHCSYDVHQLRTGLKAILGGQPSLGLVQVDILALLVRYQELLGKNLVKRTRDNGALLIATCMISPMQSISSSSLLRLDHSVFFFCFIFSANPRRV